MLKFNGIDLCDIAPVDIIDIEIQAAKVDVSAIDRPQKNGSYFVRRRVKERKVVVSFTLFDDSIEQRNRYATNVMQWCSANAPSPLYLPHHDGEYLLAVCTDMPGFSELARWETIKMTFTAYDPEWIDASERVAPCGIPFSVGHSEPPLMILKHSLSEAATEGLSWTLDATHTFSLTGTVGIGELVIDFNRKTIELDGESVLVQLPLGQDIPDILPGIHTLTGSGKLHWHERWL